MSFTSIQYSHFKKDMQLIVSTRGFNFHLLEWLELPKALTPRQTVVFFRHAFYKAINKLVKYRKELSVESKYW